MARGAAALLVPPACVACGAALDGDPDAGAAPCLRCRAGLGLERRLLAAPRGMGACVAGARFEGEALAWIHRFKYPAPGLAGLDPAPGTIVRWLALEAAAAMPGDPPDALVAVPLHPRRLRRRGFNPAVVLARAVARRLDRPLDAGALVRVRDTPSQTGLGRAERARNVADAFAARRRVPGRIWLVDDVTTTGATLAACARALRRAGAEEVGAVCAAYTPERRERA